MAKATEIGGISPFFIVKDVAAAFAFYCDKLGFEIMYQAEPEVLYFGIVKRDGAMIFLKEVGVEPIPNYTRDVGGGIAPWDAYVYVPDPTRWRRSLPNAMSNFPSRSKTRTTASAVSK